jgi:hypothetical protein
MGIWYDERLLINGRWRKKSTKVMLQRLFNLQMLLFPHYLSVNRAQRSAAAAAEHTAAAVASS